MPEKLADFLSQRQRSTALALLLSLSLWAALLLLLPRPLTTLEELSGDTLWRLAASQTPERRLIIVDIDESTLQTHGPWPWPRERLARLADKLSQAGAALQIYDLVLPAPAPGDNLLSAALVKGNAVLGQILNLHPTATDQDLSLAQGQLNSPLNWPACPGLFPQAHGYIGNVPAYAALPAGHITPALGDDGIIRHQPAIICNENSAYPALFITAAQHSGGAGEPGVSLNLNSGGVSLLAPPWQLAPLPLATHPLPLDRKGQVRIPWLTHPDALIAVSAGQILKGQLPEHLLDNAWVLVGSTALGASDRIATPFSSIGAGLQVHAQLLLGLLDGKIPATPRGEPLLAGVLMLLASLILLKQRQRHPILGLLLTGVGLASLCFALKAALLLTQAVWIEWLPPALYILILSLTLSLFEHARSRFERNLIYAHLTSYLTAPVAAALAERAPTSAIEASRRDIIVLYADIRNFSAYCDSRPPEETTAVLHTLISAATTIVEAHGGSVQAIQGDGILAVWRGDPGPTPQSLQNTSYDESAQAALSAAIALNRAARDILPDPDPGQLQSLALGIGLESGPATIGSFGLARRRTHLVLGRAVTIAIRLEAMTAELAHPILIGENLAAYLAVDLAPQKLDSQGVFLLDGISTPVHIYAYPLKHCV